MTIAIPDTEQLLDKGATLAGKWGAGSVCGVLIVIAAIVGAFKGAPTYWQDYIDKENREITSRQVIETSKLEAEKEARKLEREMQQSAIGAITVRMEANIRELQTIQEVMKTGNKQLNDINDVLNKNSTEIAKGFEFTIKRLEEIAMATGRLSQGGTKHPLAELPAPLIRPLYTLIPKEKTPET